MKFDAKTTKELAYYVYRLIDPRNGETFYVGKGKGNRVFAHAKAEQGAIEDAVSDKLKRIREIQVAGFEVAHVIHRHGMDGATALEVEAALMDAYPGLTNIAGGHGNSDFGVMHAKEVIARYATPEADFQHNVILISVRHSSSERSLYEATRYAWRVSLKKAKLAEYVLPHVQGMIKGAFQPTKWMKATVANFGGRAEGADWPGRYGFEGVEAPAEIQALYVGKRIPDEFRQRGAANPIRYVGERYSAGS